MKVTASGFDDGGINGGPGGAGRRSTTVGDTLTFTLRGTTVDLFYLRIDGGGSFSVTIDGNVLAASVSADGGTSIVKATYSGLTAGTYTVVVTMLTVNGLGLWVYGASGRNATGVVVHNYGLQSANSETLVQDPGFGLTAAWSGGTQNPPTSSSSLSASGTAPSGRPVASGTWASLSQPMTPQGRAKDRPTKSCPGRRHYRPGSPP